MANSILMLFNTEITPDRNCKIDKIERYLESCESLNIGEFQYQKIGLSMTIKIKADQSLVANKQYNYARIEQDGRPYYFFINSADWVARKTVALNLVMDTINTWWDDLKWNGKTTISRQHMDRWLGMDGSSLRNRIDHYSEGFNPTLNWAQKEESIEGTRCYVVYKTRDGITQDEVEKPISALVLYDDPVVVAGEKNNPIIGNVLFNTYLDVGDIMFITGSGLVDGANIKFSNATFTLNQYNEENNDYLRMFRITRTSSVDYTFTALWYQGTTYPYSWHRTTSAKITEGALRVWFNNIREYHITPNTDEYRNITSVNTIDGLPATVINSGLISAQITTPFNEFDRSNSLFMKIVQVPYDIVKGHRNNQTNDYVFEEGWSFAYGWNGIQVDLNNQNFTADVATIEPTEIFYTTIAKSPNINDEFKGAALEPKLWNSEFTNIFLNFDAETIQIKPERITKINRVPTFDIKFALSNAISSDMMFKVDWNVDYIKESKYDGTMISARNMEKPIYTNGYVDYLRNGYNWDQAAVKRQNQTARINTILGYVGAGVQAGFGALNIGRISNLASGAGELNSRIKSLKEGLSGYKEHPSKADVAKGIQNATAYKEKYGISLAEAKRNLSQTQSDLSEAQAARHQLAQQYLGFGSLLGGNIINSIQSAINATRSIESNNQNFRAGIANKQAQSSGIEGSSNVDLFTQYSDGAHLEYNIYGLRQEDKENLARVFYYTGYAHPVQEIPNFDSRSWFNFVQCDAVFDDEATSIYNNYIDDIKERFAIGITVYHNNNNVYDFNQTKENWETSILNA